MEIIVNHLTRMQAGYMCVAGADVETGRHIRPMLLGRLKTELLARHGGPFDIGCLVDLGRTTRMRHRPEVEDHRFHLHNVVRKEDISPADFWQLLERLARRRLRDIFGPALTMRGETSCGTDAGRGRASLGCLHAESRPQLFMRRCAGQQPRVRMRLDDGEFDVELGVTDIRLFGGDHVTPDAATLARVAWKLANEPHVILSVGLTRPYSPTADVPPIHWLQVNNIHFPDDPCWQLGAPGPRRGSA